MGALTANQHAAGHSVVSVQGRAARHTVGPQRSFGGSRRERPSAQCHAPRRRGTRWAWSMNSVGVVTAGEASSRHCSLSPCQGGWSCRPTDEEGTRPMGEWGVWPGWVAGVLLAGSLQFSSFRLRKHYSLPPPAQQKRIKTVSAVTAARQVQPFHRSGPTKGGGVTVAMRTGTAGFPPRLSDGAAADSDARAAARATVAAAA